MSKAMTFVKEHKKEFAIGIATAVGFVGLCVLTRVISKRNDLPIPNMATGEIRDLWKEGGVNYVIFGNVKIKDLGNFGKEAIEAGIYNVGDTLGGMISAMSK